MSTRNFVEVADGVATKVFTDPKMCSQELRFYQLVPWAAPKLLDHGNNYLVMEALTPATALRNWRSRSQLRDLLQRLHDGGVNHRDVHIENLLRCPNRGPVLIDWEWATTEIGSLSFDLYGPGPSSTPHPRGKRGISMWIGAKHRLSVRNAWR